MAKNFLASSFLFLFIYIFIALGVFYKLDWVYNLDMSVISFIQSFITDSRTALIIILTDFAGTISIIILTALTVIFLIYKRMYILSLWFGMTILLGPGIFVYIMKKNRR
jgi:undecaprenyl-diphosphatase